MPGQGPAADSSEEGTLTPCWLIPPQGSSFREVPTHMSHPPVSGPPLPFSVLISSKPGMLKDPGPLRGDGRDFGAPRPPETTKELVAL